MNDAKHIAYCAIQQVMEKGSAVDGNDDSWRDKGVLYHGMKALRHTATGLMQAQGISSPDGEDHFKLALTRLAMLIACQS